MPAARAPVDSLPETGLLPVQLLEAEQEVALVEAQVIVALWPKSIVVGFTEIVTTGTGVGGGEATLTVTDRLAVPPAPVQVKVYVLPAVKLPVLSFPETLFPPDQSPEAVQEVVSVEAQVKMAAVL